MLRKLDGDSGAIPAVFDRFENACADISAFFHALMNRITTGIEGENKEWLEVARDLLLKEGSLYFEVARGSFSRDVADLAHVGSISAALSADGDGAKVYGRCIFAGNVRRLHKGNFPEPNLSHLGQVKLFAKNKDIPAAGRYHRYAADAIPVGLDLMQRLAGALDEVTAEHRRGQTWRSIPGERPKQSDLLLAFVDQALEAPLADAIADGGEDMADDREPIDRRAGFLTRTERVIEAVKAKVGADFRKTPVHLCVLRNVDPGNAKAILHRAFTVGELYDAAIAWADAQGNLPDWLEMPVATKAKTLARRGAPTIAPLQLPRLTRTTFIRAGREKAKREPVGVTAQDALILFLNESGVERATWATLRLMLGRQGALSSGAAHALRKDAGAEKLAHAAKYDRAAALQALGLLGLLLSKLGRRKEKYMSETAFKLGQLLAVADAVHVGYCTDLRGGDVPPTLLGNAVLATAQSDPATALAVLSRRWKPYAAWAKRPAVREKAFKLTRQTATKDEKRRGWPMRTAILQAAGADALCRELHGKLPRRVDDAFRAELLLGYVAGLPEKSNREAEGYQREGAYWDARVFGNTFLESMKQEEGDGDGDKGKKGAKQRAGEKDHFISTGAVQFGPGISIAPIDIEYQTWTNKAGVQEGKDRGMAPLAWRFVPHAVYAMPYFVNPLMARKGGCTATDIDLMKFLIPLAYRATASVARPDVEILHAWYAEHKSPLGSCPDYRIIDAMTPRKKGEPDQPSRSASDYEIPQELPGDVRARLASFEDLCMKDWTVGDR